MFSALARIARIARRGPRTPRAPRCCDYSTGADGPAPAAPTAAPKTTHYRITLYRSPIGLTKRRHDSLASLGLRRRMDVVYHRHSPDAAGLILSVKEILKVENVSEDEMKMGQQSSRKLVADDRGYRLIRNVLQRD